MRVLMLTQKLDTRDWLVSFIPAWADALARCVDHLDIVALEVGSYTPPANTHVYSMGKEAGRSRASLMAAFYRRVLPLIRHANAVFVHMIPRYALMVAPLAALFRKPVTLWYTHRHAGRELRLAVRVCRRVLTAASDSFPLKTPKLRVLGHGIDTGFYAPSAEHSPYTATAEALPLIVHVARLMPIKNQATLIRAIASDVPAQAAIIGAVPDGQDASYRDSLEALARDLGAVDRVTFTGGLKSSDVVTQYRFAAAAVNLSPVGLFDKAALESMAAGTPTIVAGAAFDDLLGPYAEMLRISSPEDHHALAEHLRALLALTPTERAHIGMYLRQGVVQNHSLDHLMPRLVQVLASGEVS